MVNKELERIIASIKKENEERDRLINEEYAKMNEEDDDYDDSEVDTPDENPDEIRVLDDGVPNPNKEEEVFTEQMIQEERLKAKMKETDELKKKLQVDRMNYARMQKKRLEQQQQQVYQPQPQPRMEQPIQQPVREHQLTPEEATAQQIMLLQNDGIFRLELIFQLQELNKTLDKLTKLIGG